MDTVASSVICAYLDSVLYVLVIIISSNVIIMITWNNETQQLNITSLIFNTDLHSINFLFDIILFLLLLHYDSANVNTKRKGKQNRSRSD